MILYDWKKVTPGWGPSYAIARIVVCPKETFEISHDPNFINVRGEHISGSLSVRAFEKFGLPYEGFVTLDSDLYLLYRDGFIPSFIPVKKEHIHTLIRCKIGKNIIKALQLKRIVY